MRESLTILAGLLVLALLAALVGPLVVDWRQWRGEFEQHISERLGVRTTIAGDIDLRLLPSPRLIASAVSIGGDDGASAARIERVTAELGLTSLFRGEMRFVEAQGDGATIEIAVDRNGALILPPIAGGLPAATALDRLGLRRSTLIWREEGREPLTLSPVTAELSAVALTGPWRIEGEVGGTSVRLATGALEPDRRLRAKLAMTSGDTQTLFDGAVLFGSDPARVEPAIDGQFSIAPGAGTILAGKAAGASRLLALSALTLDLAGAARFEGEGELRPHGGGALAWRARRVDGDALASALPDNGGAARLLSLVPGAIDTTIEVEQLVLRGEDLSNLALRGRLSGDGLDRVEGSARLAGATLAARGAVKGNAVEGSAELDAPDARRLALVLVRAGLDPSLADMVAGLGTARIAAQGGWQTDRLTLDRLTATGSSGLALEASGRLTPALFEGRAALRGLDLNTLPSGEVLAGAFGRRDLALDLSLAQARFRNAPPGSLALGLRRTGSEWRLERLAIDGFGGVVVTGTGALLAQGGEISGRIRAPRFETLAALAGPLMPDALRATLARASDGLADLDAGYRLSRAAQGQTAANAQGQARGGRFRLDGRLDPAGAWTGGTIAVELADRRLAFATLGLPRPQIAAPGAVSLHVDGAELAGSLSGPGLAIGIERRAGQPLRLNAQAETAAHLLPEGPARLLPAGPVDLAARLTPGEDRIAVDDLVINSGGQSARGSLVIPIEGATTGTLDLPRLDLAALLAGGLGTALAAPQGWSSQRFGAASSLGDLALTLTARSMRLADGFELGQPRLALRSDGDALRLDQIAGEFGKGRAAGNLVMRREGGLAQLNGALTLERVDVGTLSGGALGGLASGKVEFGGSGESPARIVAGLSGAGSLAIEDASIARFDPSAYARVIAATGEDASESETPRLQRRLGEALDAAPWRLGRVEVPFTLAAGLIRLQPVAIERGGLAAEASGLVDLRLLSADLRLALRPLGPMPKGWPSSAPQIAVAWRGPLSGLRREADVSAFANTVAARALAREIERVEAFDADARERAAQARRLRAERETRENERRLAEFLRAEEERRIAEEKRQEELRRAEEARIAEEARRAELARKVEEQRRAVEEARKAEEAKRAEEARRRAELDEARRAAQRPSGAPLVLPGAQPETLPGTVQPALPVRPPGLN